MAISPVNIPITAHDKTAAAFKSVSKRLSSLNKSIGASVTRVAKIGTAFAAAGVASSVALTKASMVSIDALAKTSDRLGIATESLAGLQHAASLAGVENKTLEKSLQNLAVGVSDAADGTGVAKDAFLELGLSAGILEQMPLDQQMLEVADAMQGVKNQADKVRIATDLFGARGVAVLNMIGSGSENLTKMAEEAEHLGLAVSRVDAAKIENANDAVTKAKGVFTGLGKQLATAFSPIIDEISTSFYQAALDTEGFGNIGQDVVHALVRGFGSFLDTLQMIQHGILALELVALKVKKSLQDVFEPSAGLTEYNKQVIRLQQAMAKGEISQKDFTLWQIDAQKRLANGTFIANGAIQKGAEETQTEIDALVQAMADLTSAGLPSDRIELFYNRIIAKAEAAGQAIADNSAAKILGDSAGEGVETVVKKLTFLEKTAIEGTKRRTEFEAKSMTEQTSHVLGELGNQFSGIASNNKKLFQLNKAFQIANAIMQTYQGATLAMSSYPPPLNFVMAAATVASGLGQVAQIKAQSFEGGGFTGRGARAGGLDGKGGQIHMLHPNETVIDHTKGQQAGGVTINQTINITTGIQSTVRAEVMNLLPAISKASQNGVADARLRGGQYARALG